MSAAVFLGLFALYVSLAYPSLAAFRDAGDFAVAAAALGAAHPPGYPLYALAGRIFSDLALAGNPAYRLNVFSAACGAGAGLLAFRLGRRFGGGAAGVFAAALAGLFAPALAQYGLSEVYALNALLALGLLAGAFALEDLPAERRLRGWLALFFLLGLGLGNHHSLVLAAPALLLLLWREFRRKNLSFPFLGAAALAGAAGFSVNLFLPFRAFVDGAYVWGEPETLRGLWRVLARADYGAGTLSTRYSTAEPLEGVAFWFQAWREPWGLLGVFLGGVALPWGMVRRNLSAWGGPVILLWVFSGPLFSGLAKLAPGELSRAILEPALVMPGLAAALGMGLLLGRWRAKGGFWTAAAWTALAGWLAARGVPAALASSQRWNLVAADYGQNLLRTLPPEAPLLMISDEAAFAAAYQQGVLRRRADAPALVAADLDWRWRRYRRRFPELFAEGQPDGGPALAKFQSGRRLVFTEGMQADLVDALCPRGLAARVMWPRRTPECLAEMEKNFWIWNLYVRRRPPSLTLARDYYSRAVLRTVSSGAYNAGLLLSEAGRSGAARAYFARALFWSPERILRWEKAF